MYVSTPTVSYPIDVDKQQSNWILNSFTRQEALPNVINHVWNTWSSSKDTQTRSGIPRNIFDPKSFQQRAASVYQARLQFFADAPTPPPLPPAGESNQEEVYSSIVCQVDHNGNVTKVELSSNRNGMDLEYFCELVHQAVQIPKVQLQRVLSVSDKRVQTM
jgi:hypothetical protein